MPRLHGSRSDWCQRGCDWSRRCRAGASTLHPWLVVCQEGSSSSLSSALHGQGVATLGPVGSMALDVLAKMVAPHESFVANRTGKPLLSSVGPVVSC